MSSMIQSYGLRSDRVVVAKRRGAWFQLHLKNMLDVYLYYSGYCDYAETRFLELNLRPGDVVFDVGANLGYYSLLAARKVSPTGQVHAFEISADELTKFENNVVLNEFASAITVNRVAVAAAVGTVPITPTFGAGTTSIDIEETYRAEIIAATSLDQYVQDRKLLRVDYLKCDIEGAESLMLEGAQALLEHNRPVMLLELNPAALARFGSSVGDVLRATNRHEYSLFCFTSSIKGIELRRMTKDDEPTGEGFTNVVAIPQERLPKLSARLPLRLPDRV
ncbi:MAG TPA: FkbM family methyltransferase [Pirellulales bacterium]